MGTPAVPGAINVAALAGDEIVSLQSGACSTQTTTQGIANLAVTLGTPASSSAPGTAGQVQFDTGFAYFCVATDTWLRVAIATW